ncbi:MAG: type VI secretion system baseplate subunit TssK [Polyangiaceae bacterium]
MTATTTQVDAPAFDASTGADDEVEALPPLAKPDWPLGLKLLPRHFEAQDRYHEEFVRHVARMAFDQPWGISELIIDEEALASGQLRVTRIRAIFPDTTPVLAGVAGASAVPPRSVLNHLRARPSLDVYIGLPLEGETASVPAEPRYLPAVATVPDYGTGRSATTIPWGRPNLRLLLGDEPRDAYSVIPIARVVQVQGRPQLDRSFVAPVLRVRASAPLEERVRRVEKSVAAAKAAVGEHRRTGAEMTGGDAARLVVATTLGRLLPLLQGVLAADGVHPREAYRVVAELAGTISAFAPAGKVKIPAFDFLDLSGTFDALEEIVHNVLESIAGPTHRSIPLERHDENLWRATLREPGIFGREFLLVLTGADPASLHANVPRAAKIAALEEVGDVIQRHLAGVLLVPEIRRPQGISLPPHAACFRLDKRSPSWPSVVKHGSIALWLPAGFSSLSPMLLTQEPGVFGA